LINEEFRDLSMCRGVLIPGIQLKAGNLIHRTDIERAKVRSVTSVLPVDRGVVAALLVAYQEARIGRHVNPPTYGQSIAVPVGRVIQGTRDAKGPVAVVDFGVTDGTGIIAAAEDVGSEIHSSGVGIRLIGGIQARLVVKGIDVEGKEIG